MRAIFWIFFTHSLFREISEELIKNRNKYSWNAELCATVIVVTLIVDRVISRSSAKSEDFLVWDPISLLVIPIVAYFVFQAQKAANEACSDPEGRTNPNYTLSNILWLVLDGLFYLLIALGLLVMKLPEP